MFAFSRSTRLKLAVLACATMLAPPAMAQETPAPAAARTVDSVQLLELMVKKGLVTRDEADLLIAQASPAAAPIQGGVAGGTLTVPYIPEPLRKQITEQVRGEVMAKAQAEGWAAPGETAEWTKAITLSGDIRVRGEAILMDKGNFDRSLPNFQAINTGGGYDVSPGNFESAPFLNSTQDRYRARIRARLGLKAHVDDWITAELRLGTGNDTSPVSLNQTLGANGPFSKYAIWLDRASIQLTPMKGLRLDFGRGENPYWTSEMLFDDDLNFDGVSARYAGKVADGLGIFATAGAFPIFNTDLNFGSNEAGAYSSKDKYLLAGQFGLDFSPSQDVRLKLAGGYFRFEKVQGRVSSPCNFDQDVCDTDATRPQYIQYGNSLFPIRDVVANPADPLGSPEVQLFGLASKFEIVNAHAQLDLDVFKPASVRIEGDFVRNLGFDRSLVASRAVNNIGPDAIVPDPNNSNGTVTIPGTWDGGDTAWMLGLTVGRPDLAKPGDWRLSLAYRYVESDALLDAFGDNDFHTGGTNAKGFIVGAGYAIGHNTAIGARYLSSDVVSGFPFSNDIVQLDLSTKF